MRDGDREHLGHIKDTGHLAYPADTSHMQGAPGVCSAVGDDHTVSVDAPPDPLRVAIGQDRIIHARLGPVTVREPVRVIDVVEAPTRAGFAYGTMRGHPIAGEEAFLVTLEPSGEVVLTIRSLTRRAPGIRGALLPIALLLQPIYRRRYLGALRGDGA